MPSSFDLILKNGKCFIDGQLKTTDIGISGGIIKTISKIEKASWFYQQRNVPNPLDFEYSESTIMGYNVGLKLGNGMVLTSGFRRTFQDMNGDGDVLDEDEMINMTSIETSFSF